MSIEKDIEDRDSIQRSVNTIKDQPREMVLTSKGKTVGAILTAELTSRVGITKPSFFKTVNNIFTRYWATQS